MSYDFRIGQKVVCVDDSSHPEWLVPGVRYCDHLDGLKAGAVYTVTAIFYRPKTQSPNCGLNLQLKELREGVPLPECGYAAARFKPLEEKDEPEGIPIMVEMGKNEPIVEWARRMCRVMEKATRKV